MTSLAPSMAGWFRRMRQKRPSYFAIKRKKLWVHNLSERSTEVLCDEMNGKLPRRHRSVEIIILALTSEKRCLTSKGGFSPFRERTLPASNVVIARNLKHYRMNWLF